MHWHLKSDEWNYFLQGSGRITVFEAPEASRTFDFTAGYVVFLRQKSQLCACSSLALPKVFVFDHANNNSRDIGYIPVTDAHYIENTGTEDCIFLEVLDQTKFTDISVAQWLALTPKQVVKDTLKLPDETLDNLPKQKTYLKPGNRNMTALAANPNGTAAYEPSS